MMEMITASCSQLLLLERERRINLLITEVSAVNVEGDV